MKHYPPSQNKGILKTSVGYTGGNPLVKNPDYKTVCTGATDHAEAVKIEFDPSKVTYAQLVGECLRSLLTLSLYSTSCDQSSFIAPMIRQLRIAREATLELVRRVPTTQWASDDRE